MITVYTHSQSLISKEYWKWIVRQLTNKYSGPDAVRDGLVRGLQELGVEFELNPKKPSEIAIVLSGITVLNQVVKLKRSGHIKTIIAGPNIVSNPHDGDNIILSQEIDVVLVPSQWVVDLYVQVVPEIANKIKVWPAGVPISNESSRTNKPIIYDKLGDISLLTKIQEILAVPATVFSYGSFNHKDYLEALSESPYLIYLAKSESQGLALQEAWAHDVPTLVKKSTHWEGVGLTWDAQQINCPYLTPELGVIFENIEELPIMIERVSTLHPKQYCDKNLSDRASAQLLLELI